MRDLIHKSVMLHAAGEAWLTETLADKREARSDINRLLLKFKKKIKKVKPGASGLGPDHPLNQWNWILYK